MVAAVGRFDGLPPFSDQKEPKSASDKTKLKANLVKSGMELVWLVTKTPAFVTEVPSFVAELVSFETDFVRKTVKNHRCAVKCSKARQFRHEFV